MPRGRKPKPVEQRKREGNPGNRPLPEPVQMDPVDDLVAPENFDADALDCWNWVVPTLKQTGMLDGVDRPALEGMCVQYARARKARRVIEAQGMFAKGSTGQMVEHPAVATERNAYMAYLRFAEQYGLTAVARTRLALGELHRKTMAQEIEQDLGAPKLKRVG